MVIGPKYIYINNNYFDVGGVIFEFIIFSVLVGWLH